MEGPARRAARESGGTKRDRSHEGRGRNASSADDAEGERGDEAEQRVVGSIEQVSEAEGKREDPRRRRRRSAFAAMGDRKGKDEGDQKDGRHHEHRDRQEVPENFDSCDRRRENRTHEEEFDQSAILEKAPENRRDDSRSEVARHPDENPEFRSFREEPQYRYALRFDAEGLWHDEDRSVQHDEEDGQGHAGPPRDPLPSQGERNREDLDRAGDREEPHEGHCANMLENREPVEEPVRVEQA